MSHCMWALVVVLGCWLAAPEAHAQAWSDSAVKAAFGRCGEPCVVRDSPGGDVDLFEAAARAVEIAFDSPASARLHGSSCQRTAASYARSRAGSSNGLPSGRL